MNLVQLLLQSARRLPNRCALAVGVREYASYGELACRVERFAAGLRNRFGLVPRERVVLAMKNCPEYYEALFACWQAGLVAVPVNAKLHAREFNYILENSGARLCLASPDLEASLAPLAARLPGLAGLIAAGSAEWRAVPTAGPCPAAEVAPDDAAWLFYTSGTTGLPKGAILTHRNLLFMTQAYFADIDRLIPGDSIVHAAPISHGSGLYGLPHFAAGALNVIPESGGFDADEVLRLVAAHRGVSFFAAPTMLVRILASPATGGADLRNLKTISYGGAPMYVADLMRALDLFGPRMYQVYGQGESPMTITGLPQTLHVKCDPARLVSCGFARTGVEVRVVDDADRDLPPGEVGEIVTRSDCVMAGYWNNPEASAATLRGGWLHTGDLGTLDAQGYLSIRDRSKDLIISGGSNIYPREIEEVLLQHPGVAECSVIGRPHPDWGEEVVAFVVARAGATPGATELDAWCLDHIARYKRPREYRFLAALPKNNYGKILKTELRQQLRG